MFAPALPDEPVYTPDGPNVGRPAHIHVGECTELERDGAIDLANVIAPIGEWTGTKRATAAESSFSVIDASLDDLSAAPHALHVHTGEGLGSSIVCGEIAGIRGSDGTLIIGLREANDSEFTGIAELISDPGDPAKTRVWVFIAEQLGDGD